MNSSFADRRVIYFRGCCTIDLRAKEHIDQKKLIVLARLCHQNRARLAYKKAYRKSCEEALMEKTTVTAGKGSERRRAKGMAILAELMRTTKRLS
jgi:hypothetical protein